MEGIMRKINDTSKFAEPEDHNTLTDRELDVVTGGENMMLLFSNVLKMLEDTNKAIIGNIR
jgi:hypothetical protein